MSENSKESFFMSDSLKDIIDKESLADGIIEQQVREENEIEIHGKFLSMSMKESIITIEVSAKTAKALLFNDSKTYTFSFMDEVWLLNSLGMSLHRLENGAFKVTLFIEGRK